MDAIDQGIIFSKTSKIVYAFENFMQSWVNCHVLRHKSVILDLKDDVNLPKVTRAKKGNIEDHSSNPLRSSNESLHAR